MVYFIDPAIESRGVERKSFLSYNIQHQDDGDKSRGNKIWCPENGIQYRQVKQFPSMLPKGGSEMRALQPPQRAYDPDKNRTQDYRNDVCLQEERRLYKEGNITTTLFS